MKSEEPPKRAGQVWIHKDTGRMLRVVAVYKLLSRIKGSAKHDEAIYANNILCWVEMDEVSRKTDLPKWTGFHMMKSSFQHWRLAPQKGKPKQIKRNGKTRKSVK